MESYLRLVDLVALENLQMRVEHWVLTELLVADTLYQLVALAVVLLIGALLARRLRRPAGPPPTDAGGATVARGLLRLLAEQSFAGLTLLLLGILALVAATFDLERGLLVMAVQLLFAWVVIRLLALAFRNAFLSRLISVVAFAIAALYLTGLLEPAILWLDRLRLRIGGLSLSALDVLRALAQMTVFIWVALTLSRLVDNQLQRATDMASSLRVLTGKVARFVLLTLALIIGLTSAGIDLTAFAFFTGALGVGIGFGMQKAISNLISGLLLLLDRSIKPGDVLELSDPGTGSVQLFGWVTALNARYVSLTTRDGTEWLVPNDELISRRIVNWSFSHNRLRLLTPIAISFECDVRKAVEIAEAAMRRTPRVLRDPAPVCRVMGFGDSSVNLEMRFWIEDPANGIINVRSDVLLSVWEMFRENGIRTPLGHRDIHVKGDSAMEVRLRRG